MCERYLYGWKVLVLIAINIIGSGLAGLSSALSLSSSDVKTTVFEKNNFVGEGGDNFQAVRNYDLPYDYLDYLRDNGIKVCGGKSITKSILFTYLKKNFIWHCSNVFSIFGEKLFIYFLLCL